MACSINGTVRDAANREDGLLFVYGTLRRGCAGPMADYLENAACYRGVASARGALFMVDGYPGFVPGDGGIVHGDLFELTDPANSLDVLDDYEECGAKWPAPQEYDRVRITVTQGTEASEAWTYVYMHDSAALPVIASGDFLA